jgi:hypothetical protein
MPLLSKVPCSLAKPEMPTPPPFGAGYDDWKTVSLREPTLNRPRPKLTAPGLKLRDQL